MIGSHFGLWFFFKRKLFVGRLPILIQLVACFQSVSYGSWFTKNPNSIFFWHFHVQCLKKVVHGVIYNQITTDNIIIYHENIYQVLKHVLVVSFTNNIIGHKNLYIHTWAKVLHIFKEAEFLGNVCEKCSNQHYQHTTQVFCYILPKVLLFWFIAHLEIEDDQWQHVSYQKSVCQLLVADTLNLT